MPHATLPLWDSANIDEKISILRNLLDDLYRYVLGKETQQILATLEDHAPINEKEAADVRFIIDMAKRCPNILSENCEVGHITGSALIVDPQNTKVLLHYHSYIQKWLQFGGHAEYETVPWMVALREANEESGLPDLRFYPDVPHPKPIDVDVHVIKPRGAFPEHYHLDFRYLLSTDNPTMAKPSLESKEFRWVTFAEAAQMPIDQDLRRLIKKAEGVLESNRTRASSQ
jgi:8-oxo-dGTP pyrophosphatase MutT (NUDIX family)